MTTDRETAEVIRSWMKEEIRLDDAGVHRVLARLPDTAQRRHRWLWLLDWRPFASGATRSAAVYGAEATGRGAESIVAASDYLPTITGRTRVMLSPVKAIIGGVLVFALGGLFLVSQPVERQEVLPGAQMTELPGVTVTVTQDCVETGDPPDACSWTASDPRLTGTAATQFTGDISDDRPGEGPRTGFSWLDVMLEGPEGSWSGHEYLMWTDPFQHFIVLSGGGAYDGWHYVAMATAEAPPRIDWTGVVYEGELPPFGPPSVPASE
jgi:hypothetical protein